MIIRATDALNNIASARRDIATPPAGTCLVPSGAAAEAARQAVDDDGAIEVERRVVFRRRGRGTRCGREPQRRGSIEACADAFTVVRASTHTMFTATGAPSTGLRRRKPRLLHRVDDRADVARLHGSVVALGRSRARKKSTS